MKQSSKLIFFAAMCIALVAALIIYVSLSGKENPRAESPVRISEIMDSNKGSVPDENGEYYDWIELYNTSSEAVDISGCGLSDDITGGIKFVFPQGTRIEAGGRITTAEGEPLPFDGETSILAANDACYAEALSICVDAR